MEKISKIWEYRQSAFTMAEILISLTIIGVIAAITLPALQANINESAWSAQRKALYSRLSQAISMLPSLNGYGEYAGSWAEGDIVTVTQDTAAEKFVTDGLAKVLNINNICSIPMSMTNSSDRQKELAKCGIPDKITTMPDMSTKKTSQIPFPTNLTELNPMFTSTFLHTGNNNSYSNPQHHINTNAAAFETKNGESVIAFYNPYCQPDMGETIYYVQPKMCANFIYDLNGRKGPNKIGKDIGFISVLYPVDGEVVAPMPLEKNAKNSIHATANASCRQQNENSRLPNRFEWMSMFYNKQLIGISSGNFWSSSVISDDKAWLIQSTSRFIHGIRQEAHYVRCIKR